MLNYTFNNNIVNSVKQECIPAGCVPPAAVAVSGVSPPGTPPRAGDTREQAPLQSRPAPLGAGTPWDQVPPGSRHPLLWTEFLTHASENITLPQTSFAGDNYKNILEEEQFT